MKINREQILERLGTIRYPGKDSDIVSLNVVSDVHIEEHLVKVELTFTEKKNPFENSLKKAVESTVKLIDSSLQVEVSSKTVVATPPPSATFNSLEKVKNIIAVSSGKGGVGKSTVSANLAVALAQTGAKVALLDADIYGPSVPKMFDAEDEKPFIEQIDGKDYIIPIEKYGVKILSVGFFVNKEEPLIWRGSMATNALKQFITDVVWGELDYLIFDLPPGTGDIHLTMVQGLPVTASIVVSTPQDVALVDAVKGINMFKKDAINVPLLGLVENMSWFTPEELPDNKYYIFGKEGCKRLAEQYNTELLAQIPIVQSIREGGDTGKPVALQTDSIMGKVFKDLAENVIKQITIRNTTMGATKKVEITH